MSLLPQARRHAWLLTCGLVALLLTLAPAQATTPIVVKLATLAPEGSSWYNALRSMGDQWKQISGGQVELRIYPGGVSGNEGAAVRKMRIGQRHAACLSNLGLLDIDPAAQVINTPRLIKDYAELDFVMSKMTPVFEQRLEAKGFVALNWGDAGWAYMFTKVPVKTPKDVAPVKMYAWEGDANAVEVFRQAGFNPVVIASVDMVPSLQSGLVEGFHGTPLTALSLQWFALAPNMLNVPWAPLEGATVISKAMWDQIPAQFHEPFLVASRAAGDKLKAEVRTQDKKAIEVMKKYGLKVVDVDATQAAQWQQMAESMYPSIRAKVVPSDVYDQTVAVIKQYRSSAH